MYIPRERVRCSLRVTQMLSARKPEAGKMRGFLEEDRSWRSFFSTGLVAQGRNRLALTDKLINDLSAYHMQGITFIPEKRKIYK